MRRGNVQNCVVRLVKEFLEGAGTLVLLPVVVNGFYGPRILFVAECDF